MDKYYYNVIFFNYLDNEVEKYKTGKLTKDKLKSEISIHCEWFKDEYYKYTKNKKILKELI